MLGFVQDFDKEIQGFFKDYYKNFQGAFNTKN